MSDQQGRDIEIACSLDAEGQAERGRAFTDLRPLSIDAVDGGLAARYRADDEAAVTAFAGAERVCCPFLDITVARDAAGDVLLRITGPEDARPIIDAFLSLPR